MDENLRKKILYIVCAAIIVLFGIIALLLLMRKPQKETIITRTEYIHEQASKEKASPDLKDFLPPLSSTPSSAPLANRTDTTNADYSNQSYSPPTTTTTQTDSVAKAWSFFRQSIGLPYVFIASALPGASNCGKANQPVCPTSPGSVTYVTNETNVTNITIVQQVFEIPLALADSLQDITFYKLITLLQQSVLANDHYPVQTTPEDSSWITQLITTREMSQFYYDVFKTVNPTAKQCGTAFHEGFCYESNGKSANLYVRLKAGTKECPKGAIKVWNSDKNALQITCL